VPDGSVDGTTADARSTDARSTDARSTDARSIEAGSTDGESTDAKSTDGEAGVQPTFLAYFGDGGPKPEGLWRVEGDADVPIVGYAPLAELVVITPDGGTVTFGAIGDAGGTNTLTLGITTDSSGNVYVGVADFPPGLSPDAGFVPSPGVYKFPTDGGAGALFSSSVAMTFANGLDFIGTQLYVADSNGYVFSIDPGGTATVWSSDSLLAPEQTACDAGVPYAIGANGIVNDPDNVYVTNTNFGRLIKIPILDGGVAGTATTIADTCSLVGADGLALDTTTNTFLIALNVQNTIARVDMDGGITTVASGGSIHTPASVLIDSNGGGGRRLLFTNATFFSGSDPGLLSVPIP
jgi:sugar lactone lactonase YvrE